MAGVHGLQHVERLAAAALADDDAVGPHAQAVRTRSRMVIWPLPSMLAGRVSSWTTWCWLQLQLGGVLDGDDALVLGDEARDDVEQRGLARAGAAGDDDVRRAVHAASRGTRAICAVERAVLDQIVDG